MKKVTLYADDLNELREFLDDAVERDEETRDRRLQVTSLLLKIWANQADKKPGKRKGKVKPASRIEDLSGPIRDAIMEIGSEVPKAEPPAQTQPGRLNPNLKAAPPGGRA